MCGGRADAARLARPGNAGGTLHSRAECVSSWCKNGFRSFSFTVIFSPRTDTDNSIVVQPSPPPSPELSSPHARDGTHCPRLPRSLPPPHSPPEDSVREGPRVSGVPPRSSSCGRLPSPGTLSPGFTRVLAAVGIPFLFGLSNVLAWICACTYPHRSLRIRLPAPGSSGCPRPWALARRPPGTLGARVCVPVPTSSSSGCSPRSGVAGSFCVTVSREPVTLAPASALSFAPLPMS